MGMPGRDLLIGLIEVGKPAPSGGGALFLGWTLDPMKKEAAEHQPEGMHSWLSALDCGCHVTSSPKLLLG